MNSHTPFHPDDFSPSVHTAFILWNSTPTYTTALGHLAKSLRVLHTALSELEAQAESPSSLLQVRCADRHDDWIAIQAALQKTLDDIQALLVEGEEFIESHVNVLVGKLRLGISKIEFFVDSLGMKEGRRGEGDKDAVLGKIERVFLNAVFEERTGVRRERVLKAVGSVDPEVWKEVYGLLGREGVQKGDLRRYEGRIVQILDWVVQNERELTRLRENAGLNVY